MPKPTRKRNIASAPPPSGPPHFLLGLTAEQMKVVLQAAEPRTFKADGVIFNAGDFATRLYLLTRGRAKYHRVTKTGEDVLLWWLATGDAFGIGALLTATTRYIATAQAVDDCEMLVWDRDTIRSLAAEYEVLAENALHIVLYALTAYTDRLIGLTTQTAEQRLAHTLLHLGRRNGHVRDGVVELAIMNEDLAGLANVSAFTASRQLKEWERRGIVQKRRGKVVILAPESLVVD